LDYSIDETQLTNFLKKKYISVLSSRIIKDSSNGKSKGFGFVNLSDYHEYMELLNIDTPIILGGKMLIIK
jgi:RNA recognition motif-containing protein